MKLVGNFPSALAWETPQVALRVRPGDRPVWVDVTSDAASFAAWLEAASAHAMPVDAVVAMLAEAGLALRAAASAGIRPDALRAVAAGELEQPRLPPTADLRAWDLQLTGRGIPTEDDELPELCLPARLLAQLDRPLRLAPITRQADVAGAALLDRAAARRGMTTEAWVLRTALAVGRS
jgi:hypothetical protein